MSHLRLYRATSLRDKNRHIQLQMLQLQPIKTEFFTEAYK